MACFKITCMFMTLQIKCFQMPMVLTIVLDRKNNGVMISIRMSSYFKTKKWTITKRVYQETT